MEVFKPPAELAPLPKADWEEEDKRRRESAKPPEHSEAAWDKSWEKLLKEGRQWAQGIRDEDDVCLQRQERLFRELTSPTRQQRSWERHRERSLLEAQCETIRRAGEVAAAAAAEEASRQVRQRYQGEISARLAEFDRAHPVRR